MGKDCRHKEFILGVHDKDFIRTFDFWAGPYNLQSFLAANLTKNYFLIARMLSFFL